MPCSCCSRFKPLRSVFRWRRRIPLSPALISMPNSLCSCSANSGSLSFSFCLLLITAFFYTNVYLFAVASILLPSINRFSCYRSPSSKRMRLICACKSEAMGDMCFFLKRAIVVWSGALLPSRRYM